MKSSVDPRLRAEAAAFRLRFACDDCVHFAPGEPVACAHGFPGGARRDALLDGDRERPSPEAATCEGAAPPAVAFGNEEPPPPGSFCAETTRRAVSSCNEIALRTVTFCKEFELA